MLVTDSEWTFCEGVYLNHTLPSMRTECNILEKKQCILTQLFVSRIDKASYICVEYSIGLSAPEFHYSDRIPVFGSAPQSFLEDNICGTDQP